METNATSLPHTPRSLRVLAGISQRALARQAGRSVSTVAALESGGSVTAASVEDIARALGVAPWVLWRAREAIGTLPRLAVAS